MWDIHILRREGAELIYSDEEVNAATILIALCGKAVTNILPT